MVKSLSVRRAWIEMPKIGLMPVLSPVALRKESVDRNLYCSGYICFSWVALRKESVDRNTSIDNITQGVFKSLSVRRAWIEMSHLSMAAVC